MTGIYIDGRWSPAQSGEEREIRCPADGAVVGTVAEGGAEDTCAAIAAARRAFDEGTWPHTPAADRSALLAGVARLLERDKARVARAESRDTGKRFVESELAFV
jgi:betaine-aldehyde dehydrogenase